MPDTKTSDPKTARVIALLPQWLYGCIRREALKRMTSCSAVVREILAGHYRDQDNEAQQQ